MLTQKTDKIARPDLFRQNGISHDEKLENMMILLADDNDNQSLSIASLPIPMKMLQKLYN